MCWRFDSQSPDRWSWTPFPTPRHRFDPLSGRFRVRCAASDVVTAARERFPSRTIDEDAGDLHVVAITGLPAALHLTHQANLDALRLDDRISTARRAGRAGTGPDEHLEVCRRLSDAVFDWWEGTPPPIVYRSRVVPDTRNLAFTQRSRGAVRPLGQLRDARELVAALVLRHGFRVPQHWLD